MSNGTSRSVAVIGAGAAGLISAKVLREAGHTVRVFERQAAAGGTWIYDPLTDAQRMKQSGRPVYSSVYASLRTNLPTALSLLPITYGVAYASTKGNLNFATMGKEFTTKAAKMAMCSNVGFALRSILRKNLPKDFKSRTGRWANGKSPL